MASTALIRYTNPAMRRLAEDNQRVKTRLTSLRNKYEAAREAAESRGRHLYRAVATQAGAFAAGAASLASPSEERTIGGAPVPLVLGTALVLGGMLAPGDSIAADGLVSAGSGALAGYVFTQGQDAWLKWSSDAGGATDVLE